ncbi:MAG TPA: vWA domain-containing protein, partial [Pirellulales bacterium]
MVALLAALGLATLAIAAESLHALRVRRVAHLAFGPRGKPALWALAAPLLRVVALAACGWGLTTLLYLPPKAHRSGEILERERKHLLLVLDVSPSMRLQDAGPTGKQSRTQRASDLLQSFFSRVSIDLYRTSVIAVFTEAKPVVVATSDMEVVKNILDDLPMQYAFKPGPTDLFSALEVAAETAHDWRPNSATLVIVSDGDTIPASGMPKLPASIAHTLVVGVGDVKAGKFIDGHQSR